MEEGDLIFEIHEGRFKNLNGLIYFGGDISIHGGGYDRDCMSFIEVKGILKSYGYKRGDLVYCKQVGMNLDEGLVQIKTDPDVLKMVDCHKGVESVALLVKRLTVITYHLLITYLKVILLVVAKGREKRNVLLMLLVLIDQNCKLRATAASAVDSRAKGLKNIL